MRTALKGSYRLIIDFPVKVRRRTGAAGVAGYINQVTSEVSGEMQNIKAEILVFCCGSTPELVSLYFVVIRFLHHHHHLVRQ